MQLGIDSACSLGKKNTFVQKENTNKRGKLIMIHFSLQPANFSSFAILLD